VRRCPLSYEISVIICSVGALGLRTQNITVVKFTLKVRREILQLA